MSNKVIKEPSNQLEYIISSKQEHEYSKAVNKLFDLALTYIEDAEKGNRLGRKAAWTQGVFEAPLFYACDTVPISAIDLGRLSSRNSVQIAEEAFDLPKETCSMISVLLGEWVLRNNSSVKRVVAFNNACEPFNMAYELIREQGYDVFRVEGAIRPKLNHDGRLDQVIKFLSGELGDLAVWLTGKQLDESRMAREIARMNRILAKVRTVMELRLKNSLYIKSLPTMFILMGSGHYFGKPDEFEAVLDELIDELNSSDVIPSPLGKVIPLTWIGARGLEFGVYKAVDDCGGALLSWFTPNPYDRNWREDVPPLESMARYILDYFLVGSPVHQIKGIERMIEQSSSKGIFFYHYVGCAFGGVHVEIFRDYFKKRGIPSIGLDGCFQVGAPSGQLLTRVRAFIEMFS
ncbi:2-hydroxyglutaryl-CoA dehydratase, D-component [Ruminiclostridium hungatei]|uniref:2-hydroxyglutaryl-CoA dehydratase, D-component n=1 Tax=Ruminiclostridium hungatei TaxID=48256 RepID=A0A1V4SIP1_RUMHU|nr:2-hydroxyacyl-CoA dehydratase family protein [Ruminiclostridium hungatei]OPX43345.1 2-hydroxyglutaryl-CoA dehydratase, D-component [Ruminiclostridium hungatei]